MLLGCEWGKVAVMVWARGGSNFIQRVERANAVVIPALEYQSRATRT